MYQKVPLLIGYAVTTKLIGYVVSSGYKPNWAPTNKGQGNFQSKSGHVSLKLQNFAFFNVNAFFFTQQFFKILNTMDCNSFNILLFPQPNISITCPRKLLTISLLEFLCMIKKFPTRWCKIFIDKHHMNIFVYIAEIVLFFAALSQFFDHKIKILPKYG